MTQHNKIANLFFEVYPKPICSQGHGRDIALQLPRVINDFRYKEPWKVEDYKGSKNHLIALKCIHPDTKNAKDYKLSEIAYYKLKKMYTPKLSGNDFVFVNDKPVLKSQLSI